MLHMYFNVCVGAISIHLLVRFILVLHILATWGSIALGVARHWELGKSTGEISQLGKGVDGGEHTVLTVAVKPTSPTESYLSSKQHWVKRPILCTNFCLYNKREHHPTRVHEI